MIRKLFFIFIVLVFMELIAGLGISPGVVNMDFKPYSNMSLDILIINSPAKDQNAEVYLSFEKINKSVVEEFKRAVSLEKTSLSFTKSEAEKKVKLYFNFPGGFSKGGIHDIRVGVMPVLSGGSGGLGLKVGNEMGILLNVPNEYVSEKYRIIKKLKILNVNSKSVKQGEKAEIEVLIKSESDIVLREVYAKIKITFGGSELTSADTDKIDIAPGEEKTLKILADTAGFPSGNSNLDAEVFYGEDSAKGNGILTITGSEEGGFQIEKKKLSKTTIFIIVFVVVLILIILLLLFFLFRKKKNENQGQMQVQQQYA
jgi:hypothetical protein